MIPVTTFSGKTVAVFGLGGSGIATVRALMAGGAGVAAWDDGAPARVAAEAAGIALVDLSSVDWAGFAALVLAPGVPLTHPEPHWVARKAQAAGVEIIGDIELFCRERQAHGPEAPFIAITGTNGKSTTTALIAHILRDMGHDVQMGGNIGVPILALEPLATDRIYVIEISSFQIDLTPSLNPTVGVLLNITPDHLDRHGTMEEYAAIKALVPKAAKYPIVGTDDIWGQEIADAIASSGKDVVRVGLNADYPTDSFSFDSRKGNTVFDLSGVASLRGRHNAQNAQAAYAAVGAVVELGVSHELIQKAIRTYSGLPHRMEEIGRVGDVLFVNDSKATNADSTEKALASFPREVFWIVGGKAKEGGIEPLRPYFPGIVRAYLIGASSEAFAETLDGDVAIVACGTLEVAVARAAADAAESLSLSSPDRGEDVALATGEGLAPTTGVEIDASPSSGAARHRLAYREKKQQPVVLLSPACASYDQFKSFEHRGDAFRALVTALPGFVPRVKP